MDIAIVGEWNTTNIGDKAIGIHAARYLLSRGFTVKVFALGSFCYMGSVSKMEEVSALFEQTSVSNAHNTVKQRLISFGHRYFHRLKFVFRFLRNYRNRSTVASQLAGCKAVLVGGGALLDDNGLHFPSSLFLIKTVCEPLGLPILCVGCSSSGNFSLAGRKILSDFFKYSSVVAVRDAQTQNSVARICNKDVYVFGDFALDFDQLKIPAKLPIISNISVNVMHFSGDEKVLQLSYESCLLTVIRELKRQNYNVTIFTTGDSNDLAVAQKINDLAGLSNTVFHPGKFSEIRDFYLRSDLVLCTRLHAAIMAINESKPSIALWVTPKIKNYFGTIGLNDFCVQADGNQDVIYAIDQLIQGELKNFFFRLDFKQYRAGRSVVNSFLEDVLAKDSKVANVTAVSI